MAIAVLVDQNVSLSAALMSETRDSWISHETRSMLMAVDLCHSIGSVATRAREQLITRRQTGRAGRMINALPAVPYDQGG